MTLPYNCFCLNIRLVQWIFKAIFFSTENLPALSSYSSSHIWISRPRTDNPHCEINLDLQAVVLLNFVRAHSSTHSQNSSKLFYLYVFFLLHILGISTSQYLSFKSKSFWKSVNSSCIEIGATTSKEREMKKMFCNALK